MEGRGEGRSACAKADFSLPPFPPLPLNSTVWELDAKGRVLTEWMGRSVIRTASKLTYGGWDR